MIEELRTQLPIYYEFLYRATYLVELTSQACEAKMCEANEKVPVEWLEISKLDSTLIKKKKFAGPEPIQLDDFKRNPNPFREISIVDCCFPILPTTRR